MALSVLTLACAAAVACWDDQQAPLGPPRLDANVQHDTGLAAAADTWIEQDVPNANHGASTILRIRLTGRNRGLLRWDQQSIQQAIGADSLVSATLEITYSTPAFYWEQGAKALFLHRLTQAWTETGATWNCAIDEVPSDGNQNCGGATQWSMTAAPPIVTPATASFLVQTGSSGTVQLNVTSDVRAWLAGTATNHGWLLKKELENISGLAEFGSRESATPPRLVLSILSADTSVPPIPAGFATPTDTSRVAPVPGDTSVRVFRDILAIAFVPGTSGAIIRDVFSRYSAQIIGGEPFLDMYFIRIPDPGTFALADSVERRLRAEPGVQMVALWAYSSRPPEPNGRYPADGPRSRRNNWFSLNNVTRSFVEVRAPQGWGCETGSYGLGGPNVGVVDFVFDTAQADFRQRATSLVSPDTTWPLQQAAVVPGSPNWHHGTAVAAVLGAAGDNDSGVVGTYWGGTMYEYSLTRSSVPVRDPLGYFAADVVPRAATTDGVRVLNISLQWTAPSAYFEASVALAQQAIRRYVMNGNILVLAAGNDRVRAPAAAWAAGTAGVPSVLLAAVARLDSVPSIRDRVIVVAGTDDNAFWDATSTPQGLRGSNFVEGISILAAPATNRELLSHSQGPGGGGTHTDHGTSYAAPMVAGAVALAWSFDPSLMPDQIKPMFLLRPLVVRSQGDTTRPSYAVPSATGSVLRLDLYTPLALLARERASLPVCGYPVRVGDDGISIRLEAAGPAARTFSAGLAPSSSGIAGLSVAQGGRRIAVHARDASSGTIPDETVVLSHTGAVVTRHAGEWRSFLERDTLREHFLTTNHPQWTLSGPSFRGLSPNNELTVDKFQAFGANAIGGGIVAPSADYALIYVTSVVTIPNGCPPAPNQYLLTQQWYLAQVNGTGLSSVRSDTYDHQCVDTEPFFPVHPLFPESFGWLSNAAWSHDGRTALLTVGRVTGFSTVQSEMQAVSPPSTVRPALTVPDNVFLSPVFSSDDSLVHWFRGPLFLATCSREWRSAASPYAAQGAAAPATQAECGRFRHMPNAPPSITRSGAATGFDLFRPNRTFTPRHPPATRGN